MYIIPIAKGRRGGDCFNPTYVAAMIRKQEPTAVYATYRPVSGLYAYATVTLTGGVSKEVRI